MKKTIMDALLAANFEKVGEMAANDPKVLRMLISLSYDKDTLLSWRAIEAMGEACGAVAKKEPEVVRTTVQRLLWTLRDESGGIAWSAPEMLGEIVINNPVICGDIPPIILSFHEEEYFLRGVLWTLGRFVDSGAVSLDSLKDVSDVILHALRHEDPAVRGLAAYAAKGIGGRGEEVCNIIKNMANDKARFKIYRHHDLVETTVADAAGKVMEC